MNSNEFQHRDTASADDDRMEVFAEYLDHHPLPMLVYQLDTLQIVDVNEAAVRHYGYAREEFTAMTIADIRPVDDLENLQSAVRQRAESPDASNFTQRSRGRHLHRDGSVMEVEVFAYPYSRRNPELVAVVIHDVTKNHRLEQDLRKQTAYFRQLFENSPDGIAILDNEDRIIEVNESFQQMFGFHADECVGHSINSLVAPESESSAARQLSDMARHDMVRAEGLLRRRKDGRQLRVDILGYPITTDDGQAGIYGIYRDASEKFEALQQLEYHARHDPLTSLLNRRELEARVNRLLAAVGRARQSHAFIYIDLDEFKLVNDTSGHLAGDQLLIAVSNSLRNNVKGSDAVARLGGDEFGIVLRDCEADDALKVAEKIREDIRNISLDWSDGGFSVGASIGISIIDRDVENFEQLLNNADAACYAAKHSGKDCVEIYTDSNHDISKRREQGSWILRLREALAANRFTLFRQRITPLAGESIQPRYEILLRLNGEDGGLVPPAVFIPVAERFNLMPDIDEWVVSHVLDQLGNSPADEAIYSINISGNSLGHPEFTCRIRQLLSESRIQPGRVYFEITETAAITRMDTALEFITAMHELGAHVALDDFGSGMSSFGYLKTLPVTMLKIDGSFIRDMVNSSKDYAITESFNRIGHALGMQTVAEFVEDEETLAALKAIGVDFVQGSALHCPEPWMPVSGQLESTG